MVGNDSARSGVGLVNLINTRSLDIARREAANTDKMCLYGTDGYWTGFERSAYFLSRLCPSAESFVVNHPGYPFPIVAVTVSDKELNKRIITNSTQRRISDYWEIPATKVKQQQFCSWHSRKVKNIKKCLYSNYFNPK